MTEAIRTSGAAIIARCLLFLGSATGLTAATVATDGSAADVQAKITAAADGDTVLIPAGTFTWSSGVGISGKGVSLRGAGNGRLAGSSTTSSAIGTGSRTFQVTNAPKGFVVDEIVRVNYKPNGSRYMQGTVTAWNASTGSLTVHVTAVGGSGTAAAWVLSTPARTTLVHNAGGNPLISLHEDATHAVELSGFDLMSGTGSGRFMEMGGNMAADNEPMLIHDIRVSNTRGNRIIDASIWRGVIWNLYCDTGFNYGGGVVPGYGIAIVNQSDASSWDSPSTMGMADADGTRNLYIEDCYFAGLMTEAMDFSAGSRTVVRHCVFDNSGITSHGADTGPVGQRHVEIYDNDFLFEDLGTSTAALNYWIYLRGGTGVIADNRIPNIVSSWWGNKSEVILTVQNLTRNSGDFALWGAGIPGIQYPAPQQVGMGHVSGGGGYAWVNGHTVHSYLGDAEPMHQWGNTGGGAYASPAIADYANPGAGQDSVAGYIKLGRDYINGVKPGYAKYHYPHPRHGGSVGGANHVPVAIAQSVTTAQGAAKAISLLASDSDGDVLAFSIVSQPAHGTLSGSGAVRVYTPAAGYSGPDGFSFRANDGRADSQVATVSITVTPVVTFAAQVNFQPAAVPVPAGFIPDSGALYGTRNGAAYGWNQDLTASKYLRDRNEPGTPQEQDTHLLVGDLGRAEAIWEMAVPAGIYDVIVVMGDPRDSVMASGNRYVCTLEGVTAIDGIADANVNFRTGTLSALPVSDGRLTLRFPGGTLVKNKVCYVTITAVAPAPASDG